MPLCSGASTSLMIGVIERVERRGGLLDRHAGLEPREEIHPVAVALVRSPSKPALITPRIVIGTNTYGAAPSVVPVNPAGATPTIVICWPFTVICLPITDRIGAELRLPVRVAEHGDVTAADRLVVVARRAAGRAPAARRAPGSSEPETSTPSPLTGVWPGNATFAPKSRWPAIAAECARSPSRDRETSDS